MELIRRMYAGSELLGVGPMAAVAGAVAQGMAEAFVGRSPELLVENGGDIYIYSSRPRQIGLLPDPEKGVLIGLALPASVFPCSVCSSSATIGHSLSFGRGELATVVARDAAVADAAATAFCNRLRKAGDINRVLEQAKSLQKHGLTGVFLQCGGSMGLWGDFELSVMGA